MTNKKMYKIVPQIIKLGTNTKYYIHIIIKYDHRDPQHIAYLDDAS